MNADQINEHYYGDLLHPTTQRCRQRIHWICQQAEGKRVLDVGCSQGITCLLLGREGFDCTGVDIEDLAIQRAQKDLEKEDPSVRQRVRFQVADAKALPFDDNSFDSVLLCEILEHLNHPQKVLKEVQRLLKDKGKVIITVPYGLLAHQDHKQTFYPMSLLETLQPFFRTTLIDELHSRQLVYCGIKDASYRSQQLSPNALLDSYRFWGKKLEERCASVELSQTETSERLGGQIKTLRAQLSELEEKVKAQTESTESKDGEIGELAKALEQTRALLTSAREGAVHAEAESAVQVNKVREAQQALAVKEEQNRGLHLTLEEQRAFITQVTQSLARAEAESAVRANKIKELEETLAEKTEEVQDLEGIIERQRTTTAELAEKSARAETESVAQASKVKELQEALAGKQEDIVRLENTVDQKGFAMTAMGERLGRAETESTAQANRAKDLQDLVTARDSRIRDLETSLEEVRTAIAVQAQRVIRAEGESIAQASKSKELEDRLATKDSQLRDLEANLSQARAVIADMREDRIRTEAELMTQGSRSKELERAFAAKESQVREQEKALRQERESAAALRKEVTGGEATRAHLTAEAANAKAALKALELRLAALEAENTKLKEDLNAKSAASVQQLARIEALQNARLREREKQQEERLGKLEADWKRRLANQRVRDVIRLALPPGARVLVISKGDDDLLNLDGRCGMHFPQTEAGVYAGHHPADSTEAIKHLEALKAKGAEFLLVPASSFWWLDFYQDFRRYLETQHQVVAYDEDCLIFALGPLLPAKSRFKLTVEGLSGNQLKSASGSNSLPKSSGTPPALQSKSAVASVASSTPSAPAGAKLKSADSPSPSGQGNGGGTAVGAEPKEKNRRLTGIVPVHPPCRLDPDALTVGCILDEFTEACFRPEWKALTFRPDNWESTLQSSPINLLFVESAWKGNQGSWQYKVVSVTKGHELEDLVFHCRAKGMPTAFWNKEDPVHFDRFIKSASLFDYVFTTDGDCIPRYQEHLQHDRIFALPFAAQPRIHNPTLQTERLHNVCFAGAYYGLSHDERRNDMEIILRPGLEYGLHIFDRQHGLVGTAAEQYRYPDIYQPAIKGYLPYDQMVKAYKRYKVFLNVNSVKRSPTMFSRRIFELLASGTPVISAYAKGIENLLGTDLVLFSESEKQTQQHLERLLSDEQEWARLSTRGIRAVFDRHTYRHRCEELCGRIDSSFAMRKPPTITVVAKVATAGDVERLAITLKSQTYRHFNLALFQGKNLKDPQVEPLRQQLKDITMQAFPDAEILETCNRLKMGDYVLVLNLADYYGPEFLKDCALATTYSNAEFIGKHTHFVLSKTPGSVDLMSPGYEFRRVDSIAPGSLLAKTGSLTSKQWEVWLAQRTLSLGKERVLAIDRFNYVRSAFPARRNGSDLDDLLLKVVKV